MRSKTTFFRVIPAAIAMFLSANQARAMVSLNFSDNDSTPTSAIVTAGSFFPFSVKMTETSAADQVNGVSYRIHASSNGVFEFIHRNSTASNGGEFTFYNGKSDAQLTPYILNVTNDGSDLGAGTFDGSSVSGPATYEIADFTFEVLPGVAPGIYTLSLTNASYSNSGTASPAFDALGTFSVTVPEPASIAVCGIVGLALSRRRSCLSLR